MENARPREGEDWEEWDCEQLWQGRSCRGCLTILWPPAKTHLHRLSSCISYPWWSGTCSFTPNLWHLKATFSLQKHRLQRMASDSSKRLSKAEVTRWNSHGTYWAGVFRFVLSFFFFLAAQLQTCRIHFTRTPTRPWQWKPGILTTRPPRNSQILMGFVFSYCFKTLVTSPSFGSNLNPRSLFCASNQPLPLWGDFMKNKRR